MGERDLSSAASVGERRSLRWLVGPATLFLFLSLVIIASPLRIPTSPRGLAHVLQAGSMAADRDMAFGDGDLRRLRGLPQAESLEVLLASSGDEGEASYPGDLITSLVLAPFAGLGGLGGVLFAHALILAVAMGVAAGTLRQRLDGPWGLLLVCLFGSIALRFLFEPRPEVLGMAAALAAFALVFRGEMPAVSEMPEMYEESRTGGRRFQLRWLVVGALLGYVALAHPLNLLLFLPAALAIPAASRARTGAVLAVGAVLTLGVGFGGAAVTGGATPWVSQLGVFTTATGFPGLGSEWSSGVGWPSVLGGFEPRLDVSLASWNALFVVAGRSVGALPYFFPLALLLALWAPRAGRSTLVMTALAAALLSILLWPFDFSGDGPGLGNAWLLPMYGALWLVPTGTMRFWKQLPILAVAGLFLWPTWLDVIGLRGAPGEERATLAPLASRWLPYESTRRPIGKEFVLMSGMRVLPAGGGVSVREEQLFLRGTQWGSIFLASPRPLSTVFLSFDGQAGSEIEVGGGRLGNTVFRGDGGVVFEIDLEGAAREHSMWWSKQPHSLYDLRLRLPNAPAIPVAFTPQAAVAN